MFLSLKKKSNYQNRIVYCKKKKTTYSGFKKLVLLSSAP